MAEWIHKYDVKFQTLYQKMPSIFNEYLLVLEVKNDKTIFHDRYEIKIDCYEFEKELFELQSGKKDRCYFSFGMQDIDIYKTKDKKIGITHSPYQGLNVQLILAEGEFENILSCFNKFEQTK